MPLDSDPKNTLLVDPHDSAGASAAKERRRRGPLNDPQRRTSCREPCDWLTP